MRIAVFTETYSPQVNGVAVFLSQLLPELSKNHHVILFTPDGKKLKVERHGENFKVFRLPGRPFPFYKGYYVAKLSPKFIHDTLKREKIEICHLHVPVDLGIQGLAVSKVLGLPVVITYHTDIPEYFPHVIKGKSAQVLVPFYKTTAKRLLREVYSRADMVTAPSVEYIKILKSYGLKKIEYLQNGIRLERLLLAKKSDALRRSCQIPQGKKIILYFGRVSFEKKIEVLLYAFKILEKRGDVFLVIAGLGPAHEKCTLLARQLGIKGIKFTGFVSDEEMPQVYADADVFVSASDTETMGITFLEAMACGLPVVGVSSGGAKELISDGVNGTLALPGDAESLAEKIGLILDNPAMAQSMGESGREKSKNFSIELAGQKTVELYQKVIEGKKRKKVVLPKALNTKIAELISIKKAITWLRTKIGRE